MAERPIFYVISVIILSLLMMFYIGTSQNDEKRLISFSKEYVAQELGKNPNDLVFGTDFKVQNRQGSEGSLPEKGLYTYDVRGSLYDNQKLVYFSLGIMQNKGLNELQGFNYKGPLSVY